jgi:hypothetical protein
MGRVSCDQKPRSRILRRRKPDAELVLLGQVRAAHEDNADGLGGTRAVGLEDRRTGARASPSGGTANGASRLR